MNRCLNKLRRRIQAVAGGLAVAALCALCILSFGPAPAAHASVSGDASITYDSASGSWTIATTGISKTLRYNGSTFLMTGLVNRHTGRSMLQGSNTGVEFQVGMNGVEYTGATAGWILDSQSITTPTDGSVRLYVTLRQGPAKVKMAYVVMPTSSVIEEYTRYYNISSSTVTLSNPEAIDTNFLSADMAAGQVKFSHFTGGNNYSTSWALQTETPTSAWAIHPQSTTMGSNTAIPEMIWSSPSHNDGIVMGWSYTGNWYTAFSGNGRAQVDLSGMNGHLLTAGSSIGMPLTHILAFQGPDLDAAGNALKNFQYQHKWDLTNEADTAAVKPYLYVGTGGALTQDQLFQASQASAHVGATIFHVDDGWESGNTWSIRPGIDIAQLNTFNKKSAMQTMIWYPVWDQAANSLIATQHPTWVHAQSSACHFRAEGVDLSNSSAESALLTDLHSNVSAWGGSIIWRQDGGGASFTGNGIDETQASTNYFQMLIDFRTQNPGSGVNVNNCGGRQISVESVRRADLVQTADGAPGRFSVYSPTYLFPADKLWGTTPSTGNIGWSASVTELRAQLGTSWQWNAIGTPTYAQMEAFRQNADIYRFMKAQQLAGRWSLTYHPLVTGDDATYYIERSNSDGSKAVLIPMHSHNLGTGYNTIYPKGLIPSRQYTITFQQPTGNVSYTNSGAYWMANGIGAHDFGGTLVWIGVTNFPGAGTDHAAPTVPTSATKTAASNMGKSGVTISWTAATDGNWISYYEVFRNGTSIGKRPIAMSFFDNGGSTSSTYRVRAVDGDGNASAFVTAG